MSAKRSSTLRCVFPAPSEAREYAPLLWGAPIALGATLMAVGWLTVDYFVMVAGLLVQYAVNLVYSVRHIRTQLLHVLLYFGIFLFLLTRPVIGTFYGTSAWYVDGEGPTLFSVFVIYLSLLALLAGSIVGAGGTPAYGLGHLGGRCAKAPCTRLSGPLRALGFLPGRIRTDWLGSLRMAALVALLFCMAFSFIESFQMLRFMAGKTYVEYHLVSTSQYSSSLVTSVAGMFSYALCAFLATLPDRRSATTVLMVNVLLTVPDLAIGSRFSFVGAVLLLAFYYLFRQVLGRGKEPWITRRIIIFGLAAIPVGLLFLGSMTYLRAGTTMGEGGPLLAVADALYKQGVTFKVLQYGFMESTRIEALGPKFFVFGDLINTITQGFVGQVFLGCEKLPDTNSVELALRGNLYAHTLSYFAHPNYLGGEGWGSSYLLESYADGGYVGVFLFSFVLSFAFSRMSAALGSGWPVTFFVLLCSRSVFMTPRGDSLAWLSFAWSTRFWLFVVCLVTFACVLQLLSGAKLRDGPTPARRSGGIGLRVGAKPARVAFRSKLERVGEER